MMTCMVTKNGRKEVFFLILQCFLGPFGLGCSHSWTICSLGSWGAGGGICFFSAINAVISLAAANCWWALSCIDLPTSTFPSQRSRTPLPNCLPDFLCLALVFLLSLASFQSSRVPSRAIRFLLRRRLSRRLAPSEVEGCGSIGLTWIRSFVIVWCLYQPS